jgi:hypothetical protein
LNTAASLPAGSPADAGSPSKGDSSGEGILQSTRIWGQGFLSIVATAEIRETPNREERKAGCAADDSSVGWQIAKIVECLPIWQTPIPVYK